LAVSWRITDMQILKIKKSEKKQFTVLSLQGKTSEGKRRMPKVATPQRRKVRKEKQAKIKKSGVRLQNA
jgi:hypothetical protein